MATTTNYSWSTPDDTALVKDGAAAIRTLGSSADTTVKALNPGTTAGDIDYYTTSTTKARVGIGTAGQFLAVNSGATAPEWQTLNAGGMTLISTTTFSGASVTLSSIPQTFNSLYAVITNYKPATDNMDLRMQFNADATASRHSVISSYGGTAADTFLDNYFQVLSGTDDTTNQNLGVVEIPDYTNATTWKMAQITSILNSPTTATSHKSLLVTGIYNQINAVTSLKFFPNSGNMTSGTIKLYGVK
jgi:hypothetical protein